MRERSAPASDTMTTRPAWGYGSGSKRIGFTALKIAVLAPMPSAKVITLATAKPGLALRRHAPGPLGGFGLELLPAGPGERVEPGATRVLRLSPFGIEPAGALQPLQGGEERSGVDLEDAARDLLHAAGDAEPVHRLEAQRLE